MNKIIFLGTAAAVASKSRDNTALLVKSDEEIILVDAPGSLVKKLAQVDINYKSISTIFLTHAHPDHIYGIASLLHSHYKLRNTIDIYAHSKVIKKIQRLRDLFELNDTKKYPKIIYHKITNGQFYDSRRISASCFKTKHTTDSLGFRFLFKNNNTSCVFTGDTALTSKLKKAYRNADYLIHDCFSQQRIFKKHPDLHQMHASSLELGKVANESNVRILVPIHFVDQGPTSFKEMKRELKKNFSRKIIIPEDLKQLKL